MAKMEELKNLIKEVLNLIIVFFRSYNASSYRDSNDSIIAMPARLKKMSMKFQSLRLFSTCLSLTCSFLLIKTNEFIEDNMIFLGLCCFVLYYAENLISNGMSLIIDEKHDLFNEALNDELVIRGATILGKTSSKVIQYDEKNRLYSIMPNEVIINTIRNFLNCLWTLKIEYWFNIVEMFLIIGMFIGAIQKNTTIPQTIFIPLIVIFGFLTLLSQAYCSLHRNDFHTKRREFTNQENIIVNDLLKTPLIVQSDLDMRIAKLQDIKHKNLNQWSIFSRKNNLSRIFISLVESISLCTISIAYTSQIGFENISTATISELIAMIAVIQMALQKLRILIFTLDLNNSNVQKLLREEKDMTLILETFHAQKNKTQNETKVTTNIQINPFRVKYFEQSQNDLPFTLCSNNVLNLNVGEVLILEGPSGSGKSTFMKFITGEIRLKHTSEISTFGRSLRFDETLCFGSLSIFEELFCCSPNPNLEKMQRILTNLGLWQEIGKNCLNIWQWMKEKQFSRALSNGQKQRLILAKMLYWVDDSIDVLALDESTSGLDATSEPNSTGVDAEKVLEYIIVIYHFKLTTII